MNGPYDPSLEELMKYNPTPNQSGVTEANRLVVPVPRVRRNSAPSTPSAGPGKRAYPAMSQGGPDPGNTQPQPAFHPTENTDQHSNKRQMQSSQQTGQRNSIRSLRFKDYTNPTGSQPTWSRANFRGPSSSGRASGETDPRLSESQLAEFWAKVDVRIDAKLDAAKEQGKQAVINDLTLIQKIEDIVRSAASERDLEQDGKYNDFVAELSKKFDEWHQANISSSKAERSTMEKRVAKLQRITKSKLTQVEQRINSLEVASEILGKQLAIGTSTARDAGATGTSVTKHADAVEENSINAEETSSEEDEDEQGK